MISIFTYTCSLYNSIALYVGYIMETLNNILLKEILNAKGIINVHKYFIYYTSLWTGFKATELVLIGKYIR